MLDVARWLTEQGLGHHAEAFAETGIAGDVLRDLTDADLRELGVNLGDRKRLRLCPGRYWRRTRWKRLRRQRCRRLLDAKRRQLTVMFVDLVGSTALAARLDPEEMHALIGGYHNAVAGEVTRSEGDVAKFMGDGVLAYFGWPGA